MKIGAATSGSYSQQAAPARSGKDSGDAFADLLQQQAVEGKSSTPNPVTRTAQPQSFLLALDSYRIRSEEGTLSHDRPTIAQFMDKAGVDFATATRLIYGSLGAAPDLRDWRAIMASGDPREALEEANGSMLDKGEHADFVATSLTASGYRPIAPDSIVTRTTNLAIVRGEVNRHGYEPLNLHITDADGRFGTAISWHRETVEQALNERNIDPTQLTELSNAVDAAGIASRFQYIAGGSIGAFLARLLADIN